MNWIQLTNDIDIDQLKEESNSSPIVIFKHSTRCSISDMVLNRFERSWSDSEMAEVKPYFLDLIRNREMSNKVAEVFSVQHESPQVLVIKNGEVIYNDSHIAINYSTIKDVTKN